jgi:hypothetical protein
MQGSETLRLYRSQRKVTPLSLRPRKKPHGFTPAPYLPRTLTYLSSVLQYFLFHSTNLCVHIRVGSDRLRLLATKTSAWRKIKLEVERENHKHRIFHHPCDIFPWSRYKPIVLVNCVAENRRRVVAKSGAT